MKSLIIASLLITIFTVVVSCKKTYPTTIINNDTTIIIRNDTTIIQDTSSGAFQYRFKLPDFGFSDTGYFITNSPYAPNNISKFNIDYFPGIDSVIYVFTAEVPSGNSGSAELFNLTDSVAITGSLITLPGTGGIAYYQSANVANALPHREITLGLRLGNSVGGLGVSVFNTYLYLYKR